MMNDAPTTDLSDPSARGTLGGNLRSLWNAMGWGGHLITLFTAGAPAFMAQLFGAQVLFIQSLLVTAPLVLTVGLMATVLFSGAFKGSGIGGFAWFFVIAAVLIVGLSWLGSLVGIAGWRPLTWHEIPKTPFAGVFVVSLFLDNYQVIFGWPIFLTAIGLGSLLGWKGGRTLHRARLHKEMIRKFGPNYRELFNRGQGLPEPPTATPEQSLPAKNPRPSNDEPAQ